MSAAAASGFELRIFDDASALSEGAAEVVADRLRAALAVSERASFVLAGGSTPRALYERLAAAPWRERVQWPRVEFAWGDERCVPPDSADSNLRMARESLLDPLGVDPARIHAPRTDLSPVQAAEAYEARLRASFGDSMPQWDLMLLGMGDDGHTASLFPGGAELDVAADRWVVPSRAPRPPHDRISLSLPALNAARVLVFLVSGATKATTLARVLAGDSALPAARVGSGHGPVLWLVDRAAAAAMEG
jgi:6-phosphogluconolactonase